MGTLAAHLGEELDYAHHERREAKRKLAEAEAEITRHHDDFAKIKEIVHTALDNSEDYEYALKKIRNVVG